MDPVAGHLGDGAGFNASAKIEPRLWRNDWKGVLSHESGKFDGLQKLVSSTGVDELDDLPKLMDALTQSLGFPGKLEDSMEDDELCQVSAALIMLDSTVKHMGGVIKASIRNA